MRRWSRAVAIGLAGLLGAGGTARAEPSPREQPVIEGVVRDGAGQPVAGADVVISRPDGTARRVAITDARGAFTLTAGHRGPACVLVVGPRGTRSVSDVFALVRARWLALTVTDDEAPDRLRVESLVGAPDDDHRLVGPESLGGLRHRTLEYGLVGLPGTVPAAPPGGVVVAGLGAAEIPTYFDGFRLNDPLTGGLPLALSPVIYGSAVVTDLAAPRLYLQAPSYDGASTTLNFGGDLVTAARGANGNDRPSGATTTGILEGAVNRRGFGGRLRGTLRFAANVEPWTVDPGSAMSPRGQRVSSVPALAGGELELAGWQLRGTLLAQISNTDFGRSDRVVAAGQPVKVHSEFGLYGVTARRQLRPGSSDLSLAVALVQGLRQLTPTVVDRVEDESLRASVASTLGLGGSLAGQHRLSLTAAFDWETGERRGRAPSREAALPPSHAEVRGLHPSLKVAERYRPAPWLLLEGTLEVAYASYRATVNGGELPGDTSRSYGLDLLWAPQATLTLGPLRAGSASGYALQARVGRTGTRLPLAAVLGAPEEPRGDLQHPAEDALAFGGSFNTKIGAHLFYATLWAYARRLGGVVEDRFNPSTGRLQLISPLDARRDYRALSASAFFDLKPFWFVVAGILQRLEGDYAGFTDPATGQLQPAGTGAFDGPDVQINRRGLLPADRPYGLRASVNAHWDWPQTVLHATLRGRLDAGTPLSATGRSVTSGEGQVYLLPSGSLGRTRAVASLDAGVGVRREFSRAAVTLALEGFNLTQRRTVVARDARLTDAVPGQTPTPLPTFQQAVAYAEPLLLRLMLGLEM